MRGFIRSLRGTGLIAVALAALMCLPAAALASFAGDNGRVVFRRDKGGQYDLFSVRPNGTDPKRLTKTAASELEPSYSPSGNRIAFARSGDIFTMSADGGGVRRLTQTPAFEGGPAYSPNGRRLAFSREALGVPEDIFSMRARDGRKRRQLTELAANQEAIGASWSTAGIAYAVITNAAQRTGAIWVMNGDGTNEHAVTTPPAAIIDAAPDWSPDATLIAFSSDRAGGSELYTITAAGGSLTNRTQSPPPTNEFDPAWAPDGTKLAYFEDTSDDLYTLVVGGDDIDLLVGGPTFDFEPAWQAR